MQTCLICLKDFKYNGIYQYIIKPCICHRCFLLLNRKPIIRKVENIKVIALYPYENEIKKCIYQLKGCFDIEMSKVFLSYDKAMLHLLFHDYVIVPTPSSKESDLKRGFNHVEQIFSCLRLPIVRVFYKSLNYKQANLNKKERKEFSKYICLKEDVNLRNKKVLLVDDIITSANTILRCVSLLKKLRPKKIKILVISYSLSKKQ